MTRLITFSRLGKRARQVFSAIYAHPGVSISELSRALHLRIPRVVDIVEQLEWRDLIVIRKDSRRRCWPAPWTVAA